MGQSRGLVLEIKKRSCIVITGDGQYLEVAKPRSGVEVGRELIFNRPEMYRFKATYLAVASIMVAVIAWWAFNAMLPRAVAYVALDINPSLELAIDVNNEIISARGVNDDGQKLLQRLDVLHEPLAKGVQKIIAGCVEYHYLNPDQENLVFATVTDAKKNKTDTKSKENVQIKEIYDCVYTSINNTINESGVDAELIVANADLDTLEKARENSVTPGRYLLQKEARKNGVQITDQELREENIRKLEVQKNFRAGELIQEQSQTGLPDQKERPNGLGKTDKPGKSDKPDKSVRFDKTDQLDNLDKSNTPVSLSPEADSANKNNQAEQNSNKSNQTNSRGKQSVPRDNGYFSEETGPGQQDRQLQNEDNAKQNSNKDSQTKAQGKQSVSQDNGYFSEKTESSQRNKYLQNEGKAKQN